MRITNIDTLSALLDRLISENIKLYFFKKYKIRENIDHQEIVISQIREKLSELLTNVIETKKYKYVSEKRTYKLEDVVETIEELINYEVHINIITVLGAHYQINTLWDKNNINIR